MAEDIVTRLRGFVFKNGRLCSCDPCLARDEAADEIERLRYELAQANNQIKLLIAIETAGRQEDSNG